MCCRDDGRCGRSAANVRDAAIVLLGHLRASRCSADCDCSCHETVIHEVAHPAALRRSPVRRQHVGWRLATQVYSDRWIKAAA